MPVLAEIFPVGRFLGGLLEGALWSALPLVVIIPGFVLAVVVAAATRGLRKLRKLIQTKRRIKRLSMIFYGKGFKL